MKKLILIFAMFAASHSFAAKDGSGLTWVELKQTCEDGAQMAQTVMEARQRGVSIREIYKAMDTLDKDSRSIFEIFVNSAYDLPIVENNIQSKIAVQEYSDQFFKACMED